MLLYNRTLLCFMNMSTKLPQKSRDMFWSTAAHDENADEVIGRPLTNTFDAKFGGEDHSIIVPETAVVCLL